MKFLILMLENFSAGNSINNFKKQIFSVFHQQCETKHLGRWHLDHDDRVVNKKIDLSNYDHCGTCGISKQYLKVSSIVLLRKTKQSGLALFKPQ